MTFDLRATSDLLKAFVARYAADADLFVREVFAADPDEWQVEVLDAYVSKGYAAAIRLISIRSGHGVGKTTVLAWIICHHLLFRFPQKTVCTAPTEKQLFDALASETKTWLKKLPPPLLEMLEIKHDRIELRLAPDESFVSFRTSSAERPEALAGIHSANVLIIVDEASGIHEAVNEAAAGSMSGHSAITILAGNPVRTSGLFYDTHHKLRGLWKTFKVSSANSPRVTPDFLKDMALRYGEDSNAYRVRVLGEFPEGEDDTVIPFSLVEPALTRDVQPLIVKPIWGLDVARKGKDSCALAKRRGNTLDEKVQEWKGYDTMQTVGRVKAQWDTTLPSQRPSEINVDLIGIGAGVCDRLRELGLPARGINVSESAAMSDRFIRLRSELWWKGREWFEKKNCHIAGDEDLMGELILPTYDYSSSGKIFVEEKKLTAKRTKTPSPNKADAFLLTLASDAVTASGTEGPTASWKQPLIRIIKGIA